MTNTVAVYGASGYTGRRVVAELLARNCRVILAGRDATKLSQVAVASGPGDRRVRCVALADAEGLVSLARETAVVINCVGPFSQTAPVIARAAVAAGTHYLDVSGEQSSAIWLSRELDAAARAAHVALVPSLAFNGVIADMLATLVTTGMETVDDVDIGYRITGWRPPAGSFSTRMEMLEEPFFVHDNGRLEAAHRWPATRWFEFAAPVGRRRMSAYPIADIVVASWHLRANRMRSWLTTETLAPRFLGPFLPSIVNLARRLVHSPAKSIVKALLRMLWGTSDTEASDETRFVVAVRATGLGVERRGELAGRGMYDLTAMMVADAAVQLAGGAHDLVGVCAPAALLEPGAYLPRLAEHGVSYSGFAGAALEVNTSVRGPRGPSPSAPAARTQS